MQVSAQRSSSRKHGRQVHVACVTTDCDPWLSELSHVEVTFSFLLYFFVLSRVSTSFSFHPQCRDEVSSQLGVCRCGRDAAVGLGVMVVTRQLGGDHHLWTLTAEVSSCWIGTWRNKMDDFYDVAVLLLLSDC